jgi:hypothetical protein
MTTTQPKVDITYLKRLVSELEAHLTNAEALLVKSDRIDYLIEMNAASGMAQGIMGEAAGLMADIAVVMQKPGAAANPQDVLKALGNIKVN